jgi:hypothetical protein
MPGVLKICIFYIYIKSVKWAQEDVETLYNLQNNNIYIKRKNYDPKPENVFTGCSGDTYMHQKVLSVITKKVKHCCSEP